MVTPLDDNPYAVMTSSEPVADAEGQAVAEHHDFELHDQGLLCRSGLVLPAICLHTGKQITLKSFPITLFDTSQTRGGSLIRIFSGVLIGLLILSVVGLISLRLGALTGLSAGMFIFALMMVLVFVLIYLRKRTPSRVPTCKLTGFITSKRKWALNVLAFLPACGVIAGSILRPLISPMVANLILLLIVLLQIAVSRMFFRGTRLKCRQISDGRFYITGFAPAFLRQLSSIQSESPGTVPVQRGEI